ncbi:mechanosensitive ion channel family protein [Opitutus sp. ER46]|uniref:mechanosensitive ion channel family protein n=1 Tax=Opitutus sp. ER46 TaxID=2161864 RepID=UPI000D30F7AA|nr:mechanosensitive ion channel family protein [Opitutus sp. ER46]PTX91448.1 mechanosensitive ion channel protein MscS [Opitutus sp. ER46]
MKRVLQLMSLVVACWAAIPAMAAESQSTEPAAAVADGKTTVVQTDTGSSTQVVAATAGATGTAPNVTVVNKGRTVATDLLERFVSWLHRFFPQVDDQLFHWIACGIIVLLAVVLRHLITNIIFFYLKKLASKTETTLDDKLFPAMETPTATLVMVVGIFAALTVLQLSPESDVLIGNSAKMAILAVIVWGLIRAGGALLDHLEEVAHGRQMTVATFMPLIKKTLLVFAVILGVLIILDSVGAPVKVFLTSLGIGGLAFALAAQDTIANLFGSFVVVMDQPFRVGDTVRIAGQVGTVEDIGLRSTKLRLVDKSLLVIPNKSVASESITNLARFARRRVEQVIGLTYDTKPEQLDTMVADLQKLISSQPEVDPASVMVYFRDFNSSSLDLWMVYETPDPDFRKHMVVRQRLNLAIMRLVESRGLSMAFPTQTIQFDGPVARQLAAAKTPAVPQAK